MNRRNVLKATGASIVAGLAVAGSGSATNTDSADVSTTCGECEREECCCEWYDEDGSCGSWDCHCVPACQPGCPCP